MIGVRQVQLTVIVYCQTIDYVTDEINEYLLGTCRCIFNCFMHNARCFQRGGASMQNYAVQAAEDTTVYTVVVKC